MPNFPGPYELRFKYTTNASPGGTRTHEQRISCAVNGFSPAVGTPFSAIPLVNQMGGSDIDADIAVETYLAFWEPLFQTTTVFSSVELWRYQTGTFIADYVSAYSPITNVGTSGSTTVPAGQLILTMRSAEGGIFKLNFMETVYFPAVTSNYPTASADINNVFDYFTDNADVWALARDTSRPVVPYRSLPGQNERLFKNRYRT